MLFAGCAQNKPLYYYGDYSETLYACKKSPSAESLAEHQQILEEIINESQKRNLRVPPGVYAELGYLYGAQNNTDKAIELFQMEKLTYPESAILMDRLIQQAVKRGAGGDKAENIPTAGAIKTEKSIGEKKDE